MTRELDAHQAKAVKTEARRVLVLAGAGSGKTKTLTHRVAHLIRERRVRPERILLATFTRRAAREIDERLSVLLEGHQRGVRAGTFHALAVRQLRKYGPHIGLRQDFSLLSRSDQVNLAKEALNRINSPKTFSIQPEEFLRLLGLSINQERSLANIIQSQAPQWLAHAALMDQVNEIYTQSKADTLALDFDDLMALWRLMLDPQRPTASLISTSFDHILVDEYQDTTPIQAQLTEALAKQHASLFVVGDDAQAIYGFRGARFDNILEFPLHAPTEVHRLLISYRNSPAVTQLAKNTLELNPLQFPKPLRSARSHGPPVELWIAKDDHHEAESVAQMICEHAKQGIKFSEQAILVRRNRDTVRFELALQERGVSTLLRNQQRFLERPHIDGLLAYLRILTQPEDLLAWRKVLSFQAGIGPKTLASIMDGMAQTLADGYPLRPYLEHSSAHLRVQPQLHALSRALHDLQPHAQASFSKFLRSFLEQDLAISHILANEIEDLHHLHQLPDMSAREAVDTLSLDPTDTWPGALSTESIGTPTEDSVSIGTIHSAKGLEWKAVYIPGLCDGRFPSQMSLSSPDEEAEERRLFYVALTRAEHYLILSYPASTQSQKASYPNVSSRFLQDLPAEVICKNLK